jgi:(E)-4-hydroxy-3-methylbut-2-enyl-diphosphate synthase
MGERIKTPYKSSVITIGSLPLGGEYPVRLQSMTNTNTLDTKSSVGQCIRIIEAGADLVRLTAQGIREAENLANIKNELRKAGLTTPLIADIHFNPSAAETAAKIVEKVRINPGNYTDKRASFQNIDLTEKEYDEELERIHSRLLPLIKICHDFGTAIRIGINHGSLSDRIMSRYGNTPEGMVRSAMEFIKIFRQENFSKLVLSMKSSDTGVMITATRMLVDAMQDEGMAFPLHLGVTEAGEGEDGRIRSAAGIAGLLREGIGDTIRVSLSEDPEMEIPVARKIADFFTRDNKSGILSISPATSTPEKPKILRGVNGPLVVTDLKKQGDPSCELFMKAGFTVTGENVAKSDNSADLVLLDKLPENFPDSVNIAIPSDLWSETSNKNIFPAFNLQEYKNSKKKSTLLNVLVIDSMYRKDDLKEISPENSLLIFTFDPVKEMNAPFSILSDLDELGEKINLIFNPQLTEENIEDTRIRAAGILGSLLTDNLISGIMLSSQNSDPAVLTDLSFSILQCTGKRITRTVYISCPTCGRTKFNLQETVKRVKAATGHLKGLKIAVMGCIVNGPGEMAGADYGYVGSAPGKVHIYKGTTPVLKNIPEENAVEELLKVIHSASL